MRSFLIIISLLFSLATTAQLQLDHLHYRNQIDHSTLYFADKKSLHSSVKPILNAPVEDYYKKSPLQWMVKKDTSEQASVFSASRIYAISKLSGGIQLGPSALPLYTAGAGLGIDHSRKKFFITAKILPYYTQSGYIRDSIQSVYDQDIGTARSITKGVFYQAELIAAYRPNQFFTFMGGYGKNFFGEGYRSLLLSDNAAPNPFLKIETTFAGIKYVNLYNVWKDNTTNPFDRSKDIRKFSAIHYLSWNISRDVNLSIFETVVWQGKDTLTNRGFDFNYINPVVFYRPVEYGLGSSDNVLIGANLSYKLTNHHHFYSQFILDEFLLSEIKEQSRWWANKYGWQLGYKSDAFFHDSLYFQIEFNGARPFTYSHRNSQHAYGHLNAPVAHPIGANFMELLQITSFKTGKHRFTNKITFAAYGSDTDSISYGQDIFKPYTYRPGDFDQLLMQGLRKNVCNESFIYEYALWPEIDMYLTASYNWRMVNTSLETRHFHSFSIGLKSRIWNQYNDF
ncbi:MAG: hypothetical protein WDZ35_05105 [Crocinitomicaceae bacterium]